MSFVIIGLNHKTAPLNIRTSVAFTFETLPLHLRDCINLPFLKEIVVLSTCNRTEWIAVLASHHSEELEAWIQQNRKLSLSEWQKSIYCHHHKKALHHLITVASGLDSMILGEPQILGQVKAAYQLAKEMGTVGHALENIFQQIFAVAKRVRTGTEIGKSTVSVARAATELIHHFFLNIENVKTLLIGSGDTIERIAIQLKERGVQTLIIANRTLERARVLAKEVNGQAIGLTEISEWLKHVDVLFSSTASPLPILGKGTVESALKGGKRRPLIMVDLAVPRDIEPEVGDLEDVYLYTIDDLQHVVHDNSEKRQEAAKSAEILITQAVDHFWQERTNGEEVSSVIQKYRAHGEAIRKCELERAVAKITQGQPPEKALQEFSMRLTNKLLHPFCRELKKTGATEHKEALEYAKKLGFRT
ncbi:MAG: glutamyl-tRNA reductase [Gammaproteobacteria bacterium]|nr:glutamyl-tRNA reductase [Gammaproteobacteria bacterium]